ncbi:unnamed protein product [Ixodes pacificus]
MLQGLHFAGAAVLLCLVISCARTSAQGIARLTNVSAADVAKELANMSIPGVSHRITTDVQDGGHRLVEIFQDSNGTVLGCNALGDKDLIDTVLNVTPREMVTNVKQDEMQYFLDLCDNRTENDTQGSLKSIFEFILETLQSLVIYPGTKWCGAGNIANNDDDLGSQRGTDMCCRTHDQSSDNIAPFQSEHGVTNFQIFTMTNCRDDCEFYNCLLNVSNSTSDAIGEIYFNILGSNCFAYGYPQKCIQYNVIYIPLLTQLCKEYAPDTSGTQEWRTYSPVSYSGDDQPRNCTQYNETG